MGVDDSVCVIHDVWFSLERLTWPGAGWGSSVESYVGGSPGCQSVLWFSSMWFFHEPSLGFFTAWWTHSILISYMVFNFPWRKWKLLAL